MLASILIGSGVLLLGILLLSNASHYNPRDRFYYDEFNYPILRGHMDYPDYAMAHRAKRQVTAMVCAVFFTLFVFMGMILATDQGLEINFGEKTEVEKVEAKKKLVSFPIK